MNLLSTLSLTPNNFQWYLAIGIIMHVSCFLLDREDAKKMAIDPMFKLEHGVKDKQKSKAVQPTLGQLQVIIVINI